MKHSLKTKWIDGMAFETDFDGHKIIVDSSPEFGGKDKGPLPKPLLLNALTGCTAMDVVSILNKMKVAFTHFEIEIEGTLAEEHPKVYKKVHLIYWFEGEDLPMAKLEKAVKLSNERYCGVIAMVSQVAELTYEIKIRD